MKEKRTLVNIAFKFQPIFYLRPRGFKIYCKPSLSGGILFLCFQIWGIYRVEGISSEPFYTHD